MPAFKSGKVLVTGANGFVAMWAINSLIKHGYDVRAAVRSESKGAYIQQYFAGYRTRIEIAIVQDYLQDGAFDEAVQGVNGIMHIASPVTFASSDPDEVIIPAVKSTTTLLQSVLKYGSSVQRIIFTSSCAAILTVSPEVRRFNEEDWNDHAVEVCKTQGKGTPGSLIYCASKVLAERAAWDIYRENKDSALWDLVVVAPTDVYGPAINEAPTPEDLTMTTRRWYDYVFKGTLDDTGLAKEGHDWIDCRDLAEAYVKAISTPEAGGERIIISAGPYKWQDWVNCAHSIHKDAIRGNPSYDPSKAIHERIYDASKGVRILGIQYKSMTDCTRDIIESYRVKGWVS